MDYRRSLALSLLLWLCAPVAALSATQRAIVTNDQRLYRESRVESKVLGRITVGEEATVTGREGTLFEVLLPGNRKGWTLANGLVVLDENPHAPALLFDAAAELAREDEPEAWQAAERLFRKALSLNPTGPYAAEAQWRAAELAWRTEVRRKGDVGSGAAGELNAVIRLYPKSPQAANAAFLLLRASLCDFWDGTPGCPEAEINAISRYLADYPDSQRAGELQYSLAYRHAALVEIYLQQDKPHFSAEKAVAHKGKAREAVEALLASRREASTAWAARAERLLWSLNNNIGVYSGMEVALRRF